MRNWVTPVSSFLAEFSIQGPSGKRVGICVDVKRNVREYHEGNILVVGFEDLEISRAGIVFNYAAFGNYARSRRRIYKREGCGVKTKPSVY